MKIKNLLIPTLLIIIVLMITFSGNFSDNIGVIKVDKKIDSNIFKKFNNEFVFVFFGYVGCVDICTPRLCELVPIYEKLKTDGLDIDMMFVNMIDLEDEELPTLFASSFHKDFKGLYLQKNELYNIQNEFNIFNAPSIVNKGEYDHTSFLFLLQKNKNNRYRLKRIYTQVPFDREVIVKDIEDFS